MCECERETRERESGWGREGEERVCVCTCVLACVHVLCTCVRQVCVLHTHMQPYTRIHIHTCVQAQLARQTHRPDRHTHLKAEFGKARVNDTNVI